MDVKITVNNNRTRTYTVASVANTEEALAAVLAAVSDSEPAIASGHGVTAIDENQNDSRNFTAQAIPA